MGGGDVWEGEEREGWWWWPRKEEKDASDEEGGGNIKNKEKYKSGTGNANPPPTKMYVVTDTVMSPVMSRGGSSIPLETPSYSAIWYTRPREGRTTSFVALGVDT